MELGVTIQWFRYPCVHLNVYCVYADSDGGTGGMSGPSTKSVRDIFLIPNVVQYMQECPTLIVLAASLDWIIRCCHVIYLLPYLY